MIEKIDIISKHAFYDMQIAKEELAAKKQMGKDVKMEYNAELHLIECLAEKINEIIDSLNTAK